MRVRDRISRCAALAVAAAALAVPAPAAATTEAVTAKTTKGGTCRLEALLTGPATSITYGGRVPSCSARFGIRGVSGRTMLYEGVNTGLLADASAREHGGVPFAIQRTFSGDEEEPYEARFDVTVQIRGAKSYRKPKRPEKWEDPGRGCHVGTTTRSGDTLSCQLERVLPPASAG